MFAQCAGSDTSLTICDIPANQTVDLFANLQGNPDLGGTWDNSSNPSIGIDTQSGVVNIWSILLGGTYTFTYTVASGTCTDKTSVFTLTVGGYAGVNNFNANACEDNSAVNLFQFIGSSPNPDLFGTWVDVSNTGALNNNFYDATIMGPGSYTFTYTVPAVGTCPVLTTTIDLTVHPLPDPGQTTNLELCGIENLSNYTAVDLSNYHSGGGTNITWTEDSGTSQISNPGDSVINVEQIFLNFGYGSYSFSYSVLPSHPVCSPKEATINVIIQQKIDLSQLTMNINSICEDEIGVTDFVVDIGNMSGIPTIQGFDFLIEYQISGPVNFTGTETINHTNPTFTIDPAFVPTVGSYMIEITNITVTNDTENQICQIIFGNLTVPFEVRALPVIDDASIVIDDICLGEKAKVVISDQVLNGNYTIDYELSGANTHSGTENIIFSNGKASFTIDSTLLTNTGTTTFTVAYSHDGFCGNAANNSISFEVNPAPDISNISISISDVCYGKPIEVIIDDLFEVPQADITYSLIGANVLSNQTISLNFTNGTAKFTIPSNLVANTGLTTFELHFVLETMTGCGSRASQIKNFEIFPLPPPISATSPQEFCKTEQATVDDLKPNGNKIAWFMNENDTSPLPGITVLTSGNYWLAKISDRGCFSPKTKIPVKVHQIPAPTLIPDGAEFCGADDPNLSDLTRNIQGNYEIVWQDTDGNPLDPNTLLSEGSTYYGFAIGPANGCRSEEVLKVNVILTACPDSGSNYDFFIPDAFSPNKDGINDVFRIPDIQYLYENYTYEIYNRWGQRLFTGDIKHPEWNGTTENSSDNIAPNGVYFYILYFNEPGIEPKQGRLYLNR